MFTNFSGHSLWTRYFQIFLDIVSEQDCWVLDFGFWILDFEIFSDLNFEFWILNFEFFFFDFFFFWIFFWILFLNFYFWFFFWIFFWFFFLDFLKYFLWFCFRCPGHSVWARYFYISKVLKCIWKVVARIARSTIISTFHI